MIFSRGETAREVRTPNLFFNNEPNVQLPISSLKRVSFIRLVMHIILTTRINLTLLVGLTPYILGVYLFR